MMLMIMFMIYMMFMMMMMMMMAMIMTMMMILRMFMTTLFLLDGVIVFLPIQPLLAEHLAVVYLCRDIYTDR